MMATALGALALSAGLLVGNILPPLYISSEDAKDKELGKAHVAKYIWDSAIIITCMAGPLLILYQERPQKFPSSAAKFQSNTEFNFKSDLKQLMKNKNYILLTLSYMINYGSFCSLAGIINNLLSPYGYKPIHSGILGGSGVVFGIITSFVLSIVVDRTKQ